MDDREEYVHIGEVEMDKMILNIDFRQVDRPLGRRIRLFGGIGR